MRIFNMFKKKSLYATRAQAEDGLNDSLFLCGVVMGPKWVAWKLTDVLEAISKEDSEVVQAWEGLHAVYAFSHMDGSS